MTNDFFKRWQQHNKILKRWCENIPPNMKIGHLSVSSMDLKQKVKQCM